MPRGRPPKPTKLKELAGNPGKRPLNADEPQPVPGAPECPEWLDEYTREEWGRVVATLPPGLLTQADRGVLTGYCQAWAELRYASDLLAAEGRVFSTDKGYLCPHPAVAMQRSAWAAIKTFSGLLGLDPSSRSRLTVPAQGSDPLAEFLRIADVG